MTTSDLKIGSCYWLKVYGLALCVKSVVAIITSINDYGVVPTYGVKTLDPVDGKMMTIKACSAHDFISPLEKAEVENIVTDIKTRLDGFIES